MSPFTESTLESAIAELLLQQGYKHYLGSNLKRSKREVVLRDVLVASLQTRYQKQGITSEEVMRAADCLCATPEGNLYDANRATHSLITEGFFLSREDSSLPDLYIRPIDWEDAENNDFCLVTQLEVQGTELRRPDGVLYVNGLPLVVLEFKSAVREEATLAETYRQVTIRYGRDIPELMRFAAFVVLSDGVNSKYGT